MHRATFVGLCSHLARGAPVIAFKWGYFKNYPGNLNGGLWQIGAVERLLDDHKSARTEDFFLPSSRINKAYFDITPRLYTRVTRGVITSELEWQDREYIH